MSGTWAAIKRVGYLPTTFAFSGAMALFGLAIAQIAGTHVTSIWRLAGVCFSGLTQMIFCAAAIRAAYLEDRARTATSFKGGPVA